MDFDFKHELALDDARARLAVLGEYLQNRHGIKIAWNGENAARFTGKYLVVKIDGEVRLEPSKVTFRGEDPGFLWRKKATEYIQGKLKAYLDPKTPIAELSRGA